MARKILFAEQTLSGFTTGDNAIEATNPLVVGETYSVKWDGTVYKCIGQDISAVVGEGAVAIGNLTGEGDGLVGNGEPFNIAYVPASITGSVDILGPSCLEDSCESDTHTVAIYQVVEEEEPDAPEEPEGIVLKDRNGKDVAYYGIETVTFDTTTEGKQQVYTKGVAVEGLEIVPDFSGGDMPVNAPDGSLVKSATIKKPGTLTPENVRNGVEVGGVSGTFIGDTEAVEVALSMADGDQVISPSAAGKVLSGVTIEKPETLIPENIAEGVDIAGIIGTFAGGSNCKIAVGTYTYDSTDNKLYYHNLGVVPDILIAIPSNGQSSTVTNAIGMAISFSSDMMNAYPSIPANAKAYLNSAIKTEVSTNVANALDKYYYGALRASSSDPTNAFWITNKMLAGVWIAIAGLT